MKKILIVNAGSSSMKFRLYISDSLEIVSEGLVERIGIEGSRLVFEFNDNEIVVEKEINDHAVAISLLQEEFLKNNVIESFDEIVGIGHRVVQGGEIFKNSQLIQEDELKAIKELASLAPLHNPGAAAVIEAAFKHMPHAKNVAAFDTSFHQTMPPKNYIYPVPREWYDKYNVRRYGAHGISHRYITKRTAELLNKSQEDLNIISCHLGNGASLAAIKNGKSYNISMGLTPLAGIAMGTRSGDIDPSIIEYMVSTTGRDVHEITNDLNKKSGILALSGVSSDFRDVKAAIDNGDAMAKEGMAIYAKRVADYIVQYQNDLDNKVDAIVFTAGIGENSSLVREEVIKAVKTMKLSLDEDINNSRTKEDHMFISKTDSEVPIIMIKTNEELMIAEDLKKITGL